MRQIRSGVLAAALVLSAAACASVDAAPPPPAAPEPEPIAALQIVSRLEAPPDGSVPQLHGLEIEAAMAVGGREQATLRVVDMGEGTTVSAQYPSPGAPVPADGIITVWRGTPPSPPIAKSAPEPTTPAPPPAPPAGGPEQAEPAAGPSSAEDLGERVGSRSEAEDGPTAPRTSPRQMGPMEPGTVLEGLASWYGDAFAGRTTACGGVFDPGGLTLATRELRCGTKVRVTGPSGASVEAVATDWGPAEWTGRRFDLSAATFAAIHHPGAGVVSVSVEVVQS